MAFQVLNLSIDIDYIVGTIPKLTALSNYDDIDSITEYVLEKVVGNSSYTSEEDDDDGGPQHKGFEKYDSEPLYFEHGTKIPFIAKTDYGSAWVTGLDQANKTCKGYFNIVSPPPKM
jgi:hypothetical protein